MKTRYCFPKAMIAAHSKGKSLVICWTPHVGIQSQECEELKFALLSNHRYICEASLLIGYSEFDNSPEMSLCVQNDTLSLPFLVVLNTHTQNADKRSPHWRVCRQEQSSCCLCSFLPLASPETLVFFPHLFTFSSFAFVAEGTPIRGKSAHMQLAHRHTFPLAPFLQRHMHLLIITSSCSV